MQTSHKSCVHSHDSTDQPDSTTPFTFFLSDDLCSQGDIFPDLVKFCQLYLKDRNILVGKYFSAASSRCFMYCSYLGGTSGEISRGEIHGDIDLKCRLDYIQGNLLLTHIMYLDLYPKSMLLFKQAKGKQVHLEVHLEALFLTLRINTEMDSELFIKKFFFYTGKAAIIRCNFSQQFKNAYC